MTLSRTEILTPLQKVAKKLMKRSDPETQESSYAGLKEQLVEAIRYLRAAMYPEVFEVCSECGGLAISHTEFCLQRAFYELKQALNRLMEIGQAESVALEVIKVLPQIRDMLDTDIQASYEGDPADK